MTHKAGKLTRLWRKLRWFFTVYIWPQHDATIMTTNGLLSFNSRDRTLGRSLHLEREFEYDGMVKTVELLQQEGFIPADLTNTTVMDVGGYVGMISIGFVHNGIFGRGIAFEPNPNNYRLLRKNLQQNNLVDRITVYNMALSDRKETLTMELSEKNFGDHRIREANTHDMEDHFGESGRKTISVDSMMLDEVMGSRDPSENKNISLVWMDIQGHEGKFFKGAQSFFKEYKHIPVAMEFWPYGIKRSGMGQDEFCGLLKQLFKSFYILDEERPVRRDIQEIDLYFERFNTHDSGAHLILVNDQVVN